MFRYYSCIFRISSEKKKTARAVLLRQVPHCYTIEASVGSFYSHTEKKDYEFTPTSWQNMGKFLAQGMMEYFKITSEESIKAKDKER